MELIFIHPVDLAGNSSDKFIVKAHLTLAIPGNLYAQRIYIYIYIYIYEERERER